MFNNKDLVMTGTTQNTWSPNATPMLTDDLKMLGESKNTWTPKHKLTDELAASRDNFKISGCATIKGIKVCGSSLADAMLTDELAASKDNFKVSGCVNIKGVKVCGSSLADAMLTDDLAYLGQDGEYVKNPFFMNKLTDDLFSASISTPTSGRGFGRGIDNNKISGCAKIKGYKLCANSLADNALTCDSAGNCMLTDELISGCISGKYGKLCGATKLTDNSLTCDSAGNCILI